MKTIPRRIVPAIFALTALSCCYYSSAKVSADWPQWRGQDRDGVVHDLKVPSKLPAELKRVWSVPVGEGHSSPVLSGNHLVVHVGDGKRETIRSFDSESGKEQWSHAYDVNTEKIASVVGRFGYSPRATPTITGNHVIAMGASGVVTSLNLATGKVEWEKRFESDFGKPYPEFGASASPLAVGKLIVLAIGGPDQGALTAIELETGKSVWTLKDDGPSYVSPTLVPNGNSQAIVTQTQHTFTGVSTEGKRLWELPFETPYKQNIITTTRANDILITGGTKRPLQGFRVGTAATPELLWENADHPIYMNSPVIIGNLVLGVSEREKGHLFAVDATSGKTRWKTLQRLGENVQLLMSKDYLILLTDSGKLHFVKVTPTGAEIVQTYTVSEEPVTTLPVLDGGWIFVKDRVNLNAFRWE